MSAPSVTLSVTGPVTLTPGQSVEIGVSAVDGDNRVVAIDFPVHDLAGNPAVARQLVNISDPIVADAPVDVDGAGFTITAITPLAGELARFLVTAP